MGEATDLNLYSYTDTFLREPLTRLSQWPQQFFPAYLENFTGKFNTQEFGKFRL